MGEFSEFLLLHYHGGNINFCFLKYLKAYRPHLIPKPPISPPDQHEHIDIGKLMGVSPSLGAKNLDLQHLVWKMFEKKLP